MDRASKTELEMLREALPPGSIPMGTDEAVSAPIPPAKGEKVWVVCRVCDGKRGNDMCLDCAGDGGWFEVREETVAVRRMREDSRG